MEDFSSVIGLIFIIAAGIYGVYSQAQKKAEGAEQQQHTPEAWPTWDSASTPEVTHPSTTPEAPLPTAHTSNTGSRAAYVESQYAEESEAPRPGFGQMTQSTTDRMDDQMQAQASAPLSVAYSHLSDAETAPIADNDLSISDIQTEIADNFDLRRAVIYSEILKPKFDECEQ